MSFQMILYAERDGIRTASNSDIKLLFRRTVADGLDKIVFYEGTIRTEDDFLRMARGDVLFYILMDGVKTVGYMWLNRFENHTARQHYCVFKEYWGRSLDIGKWVLHEILHKKDNAGNYIFDLLTGFVPVWNQKAINFSLKCGGKTYGVIPNSIFNGETMQSEDAVFIYYTRGQQE